ncbi:MAG: hypothetical protein ACRD2G_11980, partial [Terriglobia bacterium]
MEYGGYFECVKLTDFLGVLGLDPVTVFCPQSPLALYNGSSGNHIGFCTRRRCECTGIKVVAVSVSRSTLLRRFAGDGPRLTAGGDDIALYVVADGVRWPVASAVFSGEDDAAGEMMTGLASDG